jgi:putative ATP-dependent endonuclease of OLD family
VCVEDPPAPLLAESGFGLHLVNPDATGEDDDPADGMTVALNVELRIADDLEPHWNIVKNGQDPKGIGAKSRMLFGMFSLGEHYQMDMVWGRSSILQRYAEDGKSTIANASVKAMRKMRQFDFEELDAATVDIPEKTGEYGALRTNASLSNHYLMQKPRFTTLIGMYEDDAPLSQHGMGTQRLLSMAMVLNATSGSRILLVDEVESGLEPYRLCNLIAVLRKNAEESSSQVIFTSHSPTAITECRAPEVHVACCDKDGGLRLTPMKHEDQKTQKAIQRQLRSWPYSLLNKRVIVCEGKTEMGFLRAVDEWTAKNKDGLRMVSTGTSSAFAGGGTQMFEHARLLKRAGFDVCILMDSDISSYEEKKKEVEGEGISMFSWAKGNDIEGQAFADMPDQSIRELLLAIRKSEVDADVEARLAKVGLSFDELTTDARPITTRERSVLAGSSEWQTKRGVKRGWFKSISGGELLGTHVMARYEETGQATALKIVIGRLLRWIADEG